MEKEKLKELITMAAFSEGAREEMRNLLALYATEVKRDMFTREEIDAIEAWYYLDGNGSKIHENIHKKLMELTNLLEKKRDNTDIDYRKMQDKVKE